MWLPHLGQRLSTEREDGNAEDRFAVAVREHTDTSVGPIVGHLPRELSDALYFCLVFVVSIIRSNFT